MKRCADSLNDTNNSFNYFAYIPKEITGHVFSFLNASSLKAVACVSPRFTPLAHVAEIQRVERKFIPLKKYGIKDVDVVAFLINHKFTKANFDRCVLTADQLTLLRTECNEITALKFSRVHLWKKFGPRPQLSDSQISSFAETYKEKLTYIDFSLSLIGNLSCQAFKTHCLNLTSINFSATNLTDIDASLFAEGCQNLESINFSSTEVTDVSISKFAACKKLKAIFLAFTLVTDKSIIPIANNCLGLREVDFSLTGITDESIIEIAKPGKLQVLELIHKKITDRSLDALTINCSLLEEISIVDSKITTEKIIALIQINFGVKKMDLRLNPVDGNKIIEELVKTHPKIKNLYLSGTGVTNESLKKLVEKCINIRKLFISDLNISYQELVDLKSSLPKLKKCCFSAYHMTMNECNTFEKQFPNCLIDSLFEYEEDATFSVYNIL